MRVGKVTDKPAQRQRKRWRRHDGARPPCAVLDPEWDERPYESYMLEAEGNRMALGLTSWYGEDWG